MQVSINTKELLESLKKYEEEFKRKLEGMVTAFAYESTVIAVGNTPLGSSSAFPDWYEARSMVTGLSPEEGFARGSWQISLDGSLSWREHYGQDSGMLAAEDAREKMSDYKIGDTVYIGNLGPYIKKLEDNYSPQTSGQGIMQPTENNIVAIYNTDIKQMFDNS